MFFIEYKIIQISTSPKLEVMRHFYKSTPKFYVTNYGFSEVTEMVIFIRALDGCFWVYRFSLQRCNQYLILAQLEPVCSQLPTSAIAFSCSCILPVKLAKSKHCMSHITFNDFSCVPTYDVSTNNSWENFLIKRKI